ncbi:MAG: symmetrical bis(5'-nucleosyl)-tetraphosphatase [Nitrospiraceae bacterium]
MAIYAIGDIQGCATALRQLLDHIPFDDRHDRLWFVGDLVNRGPESADTLRLIRSLGDRAVTVLGNHDLYLLAVSAGVMPLRPKDTLSSVLDAPDRDDLIEWVRRRPLLYREGPFVLVHGGLLPQWTVEEAEDYAHDIEQGLRGPEYRSTLEAMFYAERRDWSPNLVGPSRIRAITDALTRIRVCTAAGELDHRFKGEPKDCPEGFRPWFEIPTRRHREATVVFGHWSALGLHLAPGVVALDSGCVWGRSLTAVRLDDRAIFDVPCPSCRR